MLLEPYIEGIWCKWISNDGAVLQVTARERVSVSKRPRLCSSAHNLVLTILKTMKMHSVYTCSEDEMLPS